jgi:DNA (cytosine-5)-methyltransferase 1
MKTLSLFTGAGGLDLGLERAGFQIAGCLEIDRDALRTLEANRPEWARLDGDIHSYRPKDILAHLRLQRGEITLLSGGPPCQPFSKSGQWRHGAPRRMDDPRAETLRAYFGVLEAVLPSTMLLENVQGLATSRTRANEKHHGLDVLESALRRINKKHGTSYAPQVLLLDAASYGVPQHRQRVFVFASREGELLSPPSAGHGDIPPGTVSRTARFATAWDALHDLDDPDFDPALLPNGKWGELLPTIPEGANYLHHTPRGDGLPIFGWRRRYWSFLLKLAKDRPSWTVQAQPGSATGPFHWRSRRLMIREISRLQCFPDSWVVEGASTSARRQLGNAVPPPLGEILGIQIRKEIFNEKPRRKPALTPALRVDCPRPERPAPVPSQYLPLVNLEADHPGAGRGPGALLHAASP